MIEFSLTEIWLFLCLIVAIVFALFYRREAHVAKFILVAAIRDPIAYKKMKEHWDHVNG